VYIEAGTAVVRFCGRQYSSLKTYKIHLTHFSNPSSKYMKKISTSLPTIIDNSSIIENI